MRRRRRRRIVGLIPRAGKGLLALGRGLLRYSQLGIVACALAAAFWGLWLYVHRADAFRVARINFTSEVSLRLPESILGTNIWALDIRALSAQLRSQRPWLKEVRVVRELPDTVNIEVIERSNAAQVHLDQWYAVDVEGYILPKGRPRPVDDLVRLQGVETPRRPLRSGRMNTSARLQLALRVLETLRADASLSARRLAVIDVSDPRQISFLIDDQTEIRCGSEAELDVQLERLREALDQVGRRQVSVRYIDVRFREPIVSPRT